MSSKFRTPLESRVDYSAVVPRHKEAAPTRKDARKKRVEAGPPPSHPHAEGIQVVHSYDAPQNELDFVMALRTMLAYEILPQNTAFTIECIQLRKVTGIHAIGTPGDIALCRELAEHFDVDPLF